MFNIFQKFFYLIIILISFCILLVALYIEHILSIPACQLCLYQRIPYMISIIICFFAIYFSNKSIWLYLLILTFLSSIIISGYHLGIENSIFSEFSGCSTESLDITNKKDLLQSLNNFLPNCKDINFRIFGLSLATINFIISIALMSIAIKYLLNEKNR